MSNVWVETKDAKTGRSYFYNKATKKTQWTRPDDMDAPNDTAATTSPSNPEPAATTGGDPEEDPKNWAEGEDKKTGRKYFYCKITKKTSWKKPACMEAAESPAAASPAVSPAAAAAVPAAASNTPAPGEWAETVDAKTGRKYWYNKATKKTTWKDPYAEAAATTATPAATTATAAAAVPAAAAEAKADEKKKLTRDDSDDDDDEVTLGRGEEKKEEKKKAFNDDDEEVKAVTMDDVVDADRTDSEEEDTKKGPKKAGKKGGDSSEEETPAGAAGSDAEKKLKMKQEMHKRDADEARQKISEEDGADEGSHEFKFAKHRKGLWNRVFRSGGAHDESTLLSFKKSGIKKALLKQNRDLDAEAVQAFKNVMSYMGDRKSSKKPSEHAKKMLRNLMVAPSGLRDEVYMQLCKQTTNNPKIESTIKGWELMTFCLATFPPSKALKGFLLDFVAKVAKDDTKPKVQQLAKVCLDRLPTIVLMGQRKQVPSNLELECLRECKPIPIRVNLVNGTFKTFNVDPYTLVQDVQDMLVTKYNIVVSAPFALYESVQEQANQEKILDPKDRILDIQAAWENRPLVEEVKVEAGPKKQRGAIKHKDADKKVVINKINFNAFLYKAKLVLKTSNKEIMSDPEAVNLIYLQAVSDVVTSRYPSNEKDVTVLAALQLQATHGDYKKDVHVPGWLTPKLMEFMPKDLLVKKGAKAGKEQKLEKEWEQMILAKYTKVSGFTSLEAKLNYLDYVQEWVFYGATFFMVEQRQFKDYPSPLTLGINCEGVLLMHPEKKTVLENYQYTDIVTWGHSDEKFIVVVGNIVQQRKLIFKTQDGKSMNHLIHDYVKFKVKTK